MNGDENEIKELVRRAIAVGEENNVLLKKMRRSERWSSVFRMIYWLIIIGLSVGAFYFLQPYVATLESVWQRSGLSGGGSGAAGSTGGGSSTTQSLENALKDL